MLPAGLHARLDRATWTPPPVFTTIGRLGSVPGLDLERTLNMGVGFVAMLPEASVEAAIAQLGARGIRAWVLGQVTTAEDAQIEDGVEIVRGAKGVHAGSVQLVGDYRA